MAIIIVQHEMSETTDAVVKVSKIIPIGFLYSRAYQLIDPLRGALICAVSSVVANYVRPILAETSGKTNKKFKRRRHWLSFGIGAATSSLLATAAGFPIIASTDVILTSFEVGSEIIFDLGKVLLVTKV